MRNLPVLHDESEEFRMQPDNTSKEDLIRFLRRYGLTDKSDLPLDSSGGVVVGQLLKVLPEELPTGKNSARMALQDFYDAIDSKLKARGFSLEPDPLLSILLERVELHYYIAEEAVRTCTGRQCDDYQECPFSDVVKDVSREDGIDCMVDKEVVNTLIGEYLKTPDNPDGKIDPRQTAQASMFKTLAHLKVVQNRVMMRLKQDPVLVKKWEILQDGPMEHFDSKNYEEHPLLARWIRIQKEARKLMKEMGISPAFEMRHDRWETEEEGETAQERGEEIARSLIENSARDKLADFPEGSPEREVLESIIESSEKKLDEKQVNQ